MADKLIHRNSQVWTETAYFGTVPCTPELFRLFYAPWAGYIAEVWGHAGTVASGGTITMDCELDNVTCLSTSPTIVTAATAGTATLDNGYINAAANTFVRGEVVRLEAIASPANKSADDVQMGFIAIRTGP